MPASSANEVLQLIFSSDDLRRIVIPNVDALQWMPGAVHTNVRAAIEHLLRELPRQAPVEVVELIDGAMANRIRRTHAAMAVLIALISRADEEADRQSIQLS